VPEPVVEPEPLPEPIVPLPPEAPGELPVDVLPELGPAACRSLRHFVFSTSLVLARQAASCWLRDCVPAAPAPAAPFEPDERAPGVEGAFAGGDDICAIATLLANTAAAAIMIVLYMRYLQGRMRCTASETASPLGRSSVTTTKFQPRITAPPFPS